MTNNIAFIPLKTSSRRLPKKNFKNLKGIPIFNYALDAALKSKLFSKIILSTDNPKIIKEKLLYDDNKIEILLRNNYESNIDLPIKEVMYSQLHKYKNLNIDNVCLIYATAALLTDKSLLNSYKKLKTKINSVMGVSKIQPHPNRCFSLSNGKIFKFTNHAKLDPINWKDYYGSNGSIVWVKYQKFLVEKSFYIEPMNIEIFSKYEHLDIDNKDDFDFLDKVLKQT